METVVAGMNAPDAVRALGALAQEHRLAAFRLLVQAGAGGLPAGAIAERLGIAASSLSFHLAALTHAGLVAPHRQGRQVIYAVNYPAMNALMGYLTENCCGGVPCAAPLPPCPSVEEDRSMTRRIYNVLFLCTGNSARSIIGEVLMRHYGAGRFRAWSAGSHPKGEPHPMAIATLAGLGYDTAGLRSKSWNEFTGPDAPQFDFIFTVCDNAAGEACPVWLGHPMTAHWGIADPAAVEGEGQREAFVEAVRLLRRRIELLVELPLSSLDDLATRRKLAEIGQIEGATRIEAPQP